MATTRRSATERPRPGVADTEDPSFLRDETLGRFRVALWLSVAGALLGAVGSVIALTAVDRVYGQEAREFVHQGVAQDWVNLVVVAPATVLLAALARRGSLSAHLVWLGAVLFTVYNYVIYTFSISFGPLFLVWVAVLGLSVYALVLGVTVVDLGAVSDRFPQPARFTAWFLIGLATLFCLVWLKDVVPALLAGVAPAGVRALGLPTNPVHVMDLAVFLPGVVATGVMLLRRSAPGYALAPASLVFLAATGMPIVLTPFVALALGDTPAWGAAIPVVALTAMSLAVLLRHLGAPRRTGAPSLVTPP